MMYVTILKNIDLLQILSEQLILLLKIDVSLDKFRIYSRFAIYTDVKCSINLLIQFGDSIRLSSRIDEEK